MRSSHLIVLALSALAAAPLAAQDRVLDLGRAVQGELRDGDPIGRTRRAPYHVWTLDGRRGQRVTFEMSSRDFDAYLSVRDEQGYLVGSDDDAGEGTDARVRAILPRDGRYRIFATAFSESGRGTYTLSASGWELPDAPPAGAAGTVRVGETREGLLEPGDEMAGDGPFQDRWTFEARVGQRLLVQLRSEDFDAYLVILDPSGVEVGSDDDGLNEGNDAQVGLRTAVAGRYTVLATSYGENPQVGAYRLAVVEEIGTFAEPGVPARLAAGEAGDGRLEGGDRRGRRGFEDEWTFRGRAGQLARVDVTSRVFDAFVTLRLDGMAVDSNDDGGEGTNARLMTVLPRDADYTLVVTTYSESRGGGRYRVALSFAQPPLDAGRPGRLETGRRTSGRLEPGDQQRPGGGFQDVWEFEGRAGQDVMIDMRSADFDTYLELRDPRGGLIHEDDDGGEGTDSFIAVRLSGGGRYRVIARSFGDNERTGFYELTLTSGGLQLAAGRGGEIHDGETVVGRLEPGDSVMGDGTWADVWTFRADREGDLVIEMSSRDFDAYLIARDSEGQILGTDDDGGSGTDSRLTVRVQAGRTYRVYANSYGEEPSSGLYRVSVRYEP